jgi:hypothetical protein
MGIYMHFKLYSYIKHLLQTYRENNGLNKYFGAGDGERGSSADVPLRAGTADAQGRAVPAGSAAGAPRWSPSLQAWVSPLTNLIVN